MRIDEQRSDYGRYWLRVAIRNAKAGKMNDARTHARDAMSSGDPITRQRARKLAAALPTLTSAPAEKHASVAARMVRDMNGGAL